MDGRERPVKKASLIAIVLTLVLSLMMAGVASAEENAIPLETPSSDNLLENPYEDELDASQAEAEAAEWMSATQAAPEDVM